MYAFRLVFTERAVKGIEAVPPCATDLGFYIWTCSAGRSDIELPGGQAAKLGLKVGNRLKIEFLNVKENQESTQKTR